MTKKEACHRLADINEAIYDIKNLLEGIESELSWGDKDKRDWYLSRKAQLTEDLEKCEREREDLLRDYGDIIYS